MAFFSPAPRLSFLAPLLLCLVLAIPGQAMEQVTVRHDGKTTEVTGRLLIKARDGGVLVLATDGTLWAIPPEEKIKETSDDQPFKALSRDELAKRVLTQLPKGFRLHQTAHYMVFYDTSPAYAQWCGSLFERLYMAFRNFWSRRGFDIGKPEFPLVAVVFSDRASFLNFSQRDLGKAAASVMGYYSINSNWMTMYDLTGAAAAENGPKRGRSAAQINQVLSQPAAVQTVSTIVHEATHQIAFNCGLNARGSDCPLWVAEGIAMFFETPDLRSAKGWSGIGAINNTRLDHFAQYLERRPADSLESLVRDAKRLRDPKQALDAYAEAWALTYFLIYQHPKAYIDYLATVSKKKPLIDDSPAKRLDEFRQAFGDPKALDTEFLRFMAKCRY